MGPCDSGSEETASLHDNKLGLAVKSLIVTPTRNKFARDVIRNGIRHLFIDAKVFFYE